MKRKIFMAYLPKDKDSRLFCSYNARMYQNSYGYELNLYSILRNTGFVDRNIETFRYERDDLKAPTEYVPCTLTLDKLAITYWGYPHEFGIYSTDGIFCNETIAQNCVDMAESVDTVSYKPYEETIYFHRTDDPSFTSRVLPGCDVFVPSASTKISSTYDDFKKVTLDVICNAGEFIHHKLFNYDGHNGIDMYFGKVSFNYLSGDLYVDMLSEKNSVFHVVTGKIEAFCDLAFVINRYTTN